MKKNYKIFTLKLANMLVKRGFQIIDWEINTNRPNFKVFIFENSKELQDAISEINKKK